MKITKLFAPVLLGALLLPFAAQAQNINARQDEQRERIQAGVRSGQLTKREARHLRQREAKIRKAEARDRRDGGRLTEAERTRLQQRLRNTSRAIYGQGHDAQGRTARDINMRQDEQRERIQAGVRSGELTQAEARRLREREANLRRVESRDRRDGHRLTEAERRTLQARLNQNSRAIYHQKHDKQYR
jgi:CRISPR/Cas system-associated endoribonuclease Cas2